MKKKTSKQAQLWYKICLNNAYSHINTVHTSDTLDGYK